MLGLAVRREFACFPAAPVTISLRRPGPAADPREARERMTELDAKDLLPLAFERSAAVQTFWNFYIVVTLGLLGFLASAAKACSRRPVQAALTFTFVAFTLSNLAALLAVNRQLEQVAVAADAKLSDGGQLHGLKDGRLLHPSPLWAIAGFHLLGDALMVAVIWLLPLFLGADAPADRAPPQPPAPPGPAAPAAAPSQAPAAPPGGTGPADKVKPAGP